MYYEVLQSSKNKGWYWPLKAGNHEIIATGEGYVHKQGALNAIALVKGSANAPIYDR